MGGESCGASDPVGRRILWDSVRLADQVCTPFRWSALNACRRRHKSAFADSSSGICGIDNQFIMEDSHRYDDIINLPHHVSNRHPQMPAAQRAMQFASYKALTGYEDMIEETGRLTEARVELDEDRKEELDRTLQMLAALSASCPRTEAKTFGMTDTTINDALLPGTSARDAAPEISVTFFVPDALKEGGHMRTVRGTFGKIDTFRKTLTLHPAPAQADESPAAKISTQLDTANAAGKRKDMCSASFRENDCSPPHLTIPLQDIYDIRLL